MLSSLVERVISAVCIQYFTTILVGCQFLVLTTIRQISGLMTSSIDLSIMALMNSKSCIARFTPASFIGTKGDTGLGTLSCLKPCYRACFLSTKPCPVTLSKIL